MAQRKRTNQTRRRPRRKNTAALSLRSPFRRKAVEFKPDTMGSGWTNKFHLTHVQRDTLLKWGSYAGLCLGLCMLQDVILSKMVFFDAKTDMVAAIILLITVIEGVDTGSVFALVASLLYYFSGSAPGPYCVALLPFLGIFASMFRQMYLHRGLVAITFCSGVALMLYEVITYGIGLFMGLTNWARIFSFLITGGISWAISLLLYPVVYKIGLIGGNVWKE